MKELEEYQKLEYCVKRQLDQLAYSKYYDGIGLDSPCLSFNGFYGTETHRKYLLPLLRKSKLEQLYKI